MWVGAGKGEAQAARTDIAMEELVLPEPVEEEAPLTAPPPPAPKSREEKRFALRDRDDDGRITQAEFLGQRRRNFDKLDANGDGRLSFEEYAASGIAQFHKADANSDSQLSPPEFATTASRPKATQTASKCKCPPTQTALSNAE